MRVQALEALRKLRTEKMAEVKEFRLRLDHLRTHKDTAARLRKDVNGGERQEAELSNTISDIDGKLAEIGQVRCRVLSPPTLTEKLAAFLRSAPINGAYKVGCHVIRDLRSFLAG